MTIRPRTRMSRPTNCMRILQLRARPRISRMMPRASSMSGVNLNAMGFNPLAKI